MLRRLSVALASTLAVSFTPAFASAQTAPVAQAFRNDEKTVGKNLMAAAEVMPEAKYSFKPTPAQMSFGDVIAHLSGGNDFICSSISGAAAPKRPDAAKGAPKEKLVARLRESFQFCESALAKVDDSKLAEKVPFFGGSEVTRAEMMSAAVEDWADHYSQLAIYLRINGLLPPTAKGKQAE
jgi:uncharacterized damage-inducible protein DinB